MTKRKTQPAKKNSWNKVLLYVLPVVMLILGGLAYMTHAATEDESTLDKDDKLFLLEVADIRMMDWAEGNLAVERGTAPYQKYGRRLMQDQDIIMKDLRELAASKNLVLPKEIGEERTEGLNYLKATNGDWFNRRFRRMIIKDHKHDISLFESAVKSQDPDISNFAKEHLPMLEHHLQMARDLD